MELKLASSDLSAYLAPSEIIDSHHPAVAALIERVAASASTDEDRARLAFELCRDEVRHSFDLEGPQPVTCAASEVAERGQGICFPKSHLLAAILRGLQIPTGLCYQRVARPDGSHSLHGLCAVYFASRDRWVRLDPRGNKSGVDSQFSLDEERLAYPIRESLGERDYPHVLAEPAPAVIEALHQAPDTLALSRSLPAELVLSVAPSR